MRDHRAFAPLGRAAALSFVVVLSLVSGAAPEENPTRLVVLEAFLRPT